MGLIPKEIIAEVIDRCNIVEIVSSYIPLKQAGRNFKAPCPFHHEKTPSFVVNPDKQIFHCFGCGVGGNVISFVMQQDHVEFPEAVRILAGKVGIAIPTDYAENKTKTQLFQQLRKINELTADYFYKNLISDKSQKAKDARDYLKNRQVNLDMVKQFRIGFALDQWEGLISHLQAKGISLDLLEKAGLIIPQNKGDGFYDRFRNRIVFPIFDIKGQCIAFGARSMEKDNPAKYINSPETRIYTKGKHLYGFHLAKNAIGREDFVIVVEGYMDFVMPYQSGVQNIVASLGTALTIDQIRIIRRYTKNVVMLFDTDKAGEAAMMRSLDLLIEEGMDVRIASLSEGEDPDSFIRKNGIELFKEHIAKAQSLFDFKLQYLLNQHGTQRVESRARVAAEALVTIKKFKSAIIQSEYMKRLAQTLGISEEALRAEFKEVKDSAGGRARIDVSRNESGEELASLRPVERDILKLMLEEKDFIAPTRAVLEVSDFTNKNARNVVEKIFELSEQGSEAHVSNLMNYFEDESVLRLISGIVAAESFLLGNKERIHHDCIQRMKKDRMNFKSQSIIAEMELARNSGDSKKLEELTQEFNNLIKTKG